MAHHKLYTWLEVFGGKVCPLFLLFCLISTSKFWPKKELFQSVISDCCFVICSSHIQTFALWQIYSKLSPPSACIYISLCSHLFTFTFLNMPPLCIELLLICTHLQLYSLFLYTARPIIHFSNILQTLTSLPLANL